METILYFLLIAGLIFFMMRFGCGSHVMGRGHGHGNSTSHDDRASVGGPAPATAIDPVCGMSVATATAKSSLFNGIAHYFCSLACRDKFEASPAEYTKTPAASPPSKEHRHGSHC